VGLRQWAHARAHTHTHTHTHSHSHTHVQAYVKQFKQTEQEAARYVAVFPCVLKVGRGSGFAL